MELPEENNLSKQMMSRFNRESGKSARVHLQNLLNIASNIKHAADIARPLPREVIQQAQAGYDGVSQAHNLHINGGNSAEVLAHLKPGVDALTNAGHAIFNSGKEVHNKLEAESMSTPGIYSDVLDTTLGVPQEHLDNYVQEANKGN